MNVPRPRIALFGFADVFEDFYPHFGVDQADFATEWDASGNHSFAALLHERVGRVTWYELSLAPRITDAVHRLGPRVRFVRSSSIHRALWRSFYGTRHAWRLRRAYRAYATLASLTAPLSARLVRMLRSDGVDILFVQDYSSGRFDALFGIARALRVPIVAYHSGSTPESYTGATLRRLTLPRADALLVSSVRERDALVERFKVDRSRCHVVLTPIDLGAFHPLGGDMRTGRRTFLFVGRLDDAVKRISQLIDAFAVAAEDRTDVSLVIVGRGPDEERLRGQAGDRLGRRATFLGWVADPARLRELYNEAEALILPSLREGFPTVVGEALACGTPVIASDVGGISEVVHDGVTGRLFPPEDHGALVDILREAMEDAESLAAMRPAAREVAERRLNPDVIATELGGIVHRAIATRRPG